MVGGQYSSTEGMDLSTSSATGVIIMQQGFGNLSGEFWLGLEKIHHLTSTPTELRVDIRDFYENSGYAHYTNFSIGDSASQYILSVSGYSGTAGDPLEGHDGYRFSTKEQ